MDEHEKIEQRKDLKKWLYDNGYSKKVNLGKSQFRRAVQGIAKGNITKNNAQSKLSRYLYQNNIVLNPDNKKRPNKTKKKVPFKATPFYSSRGWRELRVKALVNQGRKCCLCGRTPKDNVILHVDHIKPRSKYPELELKLSNLQILCADCNLGKSNKYEEDWR